jgi:hypothetical protein
MNNDMSRDSFNHLGRFSAHAASIFETETFGSRNLKSYNNNISDEGDYQRLNYHWNEMWKKW